VSLNREAILAAQDLPREEVQVPEWGGSVWISAMSGAARDEWEDSLQAPPGEKVNLSNIRARLVCFTAVDEAGKRLFSLKDAEALGAKSGKALARCAKVAQRLSGIGAGAHEAARGNSSGDRSAASMSSSPTATSAPSASSSGDSRAQS
jgi:hypothetical protein